MYYVDIRLDEAVKTAWPDAIIVNETYEPYKGSHREIGPGKITPLQDVLVRLGLRQEDVRNLVLVAFSEGNQGIRAQLLSGAEPSAVVSIDGIHNSPKEGYKRGETLNYHVVPYRQFASQAALEERVMIITHSQIQPPDFAAVKDIVAEILYPDGEIPVAAGEGADRQVTGFVDNNLVVEGYSGGADTDHQYQAKVVLPAKLAQARALLAGQHIGFDLGTGRNHPYTTDDIKPWVSSLKSNPSAEDMPEEQPSDQSVGGSFWWWVAGLGLIGSAVFLYKKK